MPIINPDLSQVSKPIEAGTYKAKIVNVEGAIAKSSGAPKVIVTFDVAVNGRDYTRASHLPTSGEGAFGFASLLRACHFADEVKQMQKGAGSFDTDKLVGQELHVTIEPDEYQGQLRDKIVGYLPA